MHLERISFRRLLGIEALAMGALYLALPARHWLVIAFMMSFLTGLFIGAYGNGCSLRKLVHIHKYRAYKIEGSITTAVCNCGHTIKRATDVEDNGRNQSLLRPR
jgi:hypothetical protein